MKKPFRNMFIVFAVSILLATAAALLYVLDPEQGEAKLVSSILVPIWVFCIIPAFAYTYAWLNSKGYIDGFSVGARFGVAIGFMSLFLPVIIAPVLMILYYAQLLRKC